MLLILLAGVVVTATGAHTNPNTSVGVAVLSAGAVISVTLPVCDTVVDAHTVGMVVDLLM